MLHAARFVVLVYATGFLLANTVAGPLDRQQKLGESCLKTTVVVLGAGVAGIAAAQALANQSVTDFLIVEYHGEIGGRLKSTQFGRNAATGQPYTIELGANWIEGLGRKGRPENPIWTLAKKWNLESHLSNKSNILTYDESGQVDYSSLLNDHESRYDFLSKLAGSLILDNLQDINARAGMSVAGWRPGKNMAAQTVEWWSWDWESAQTPEVSSLVFGMAASNLTFNRFSDESSFVTDPRGFKAFIQGEASTFLENGHNDPKLLFNTVVDKLKYSESGVMVYNTDGSCIHADYAICTFSLGVLQNNVVQFSPSLPQWKQLAIEMFRIGTYTKIFLQFDRQFWPSGVEYMLYANPHKRGYYPAWQSLSLEGFHPNSNILFATVVGDESYRIEAQSDSQTKAEVMQVLREMFPDVDVPEPLDFFYPRWSLEPWAHGSYSDWPLGTTLEMHQNLRANVGRLWFAGEALSAQYVGLLQGAWLEGKDVGLSIANLINGNCTAYGNADCGQEARYERLHGMTPLKQYNSRNGWPLSSFEEPTDRS